MDRQVETYHTFWKGRYLWAVKGCDPIQKFVFYSIDYPVLAELVMKGKPDSLAVSTSEGHGLENFEKTSPETGLLPDFLVRTDGGGYEPAPPFFLESRHDGDYSFNACRTPWRLSLDYILSGDRSLKPMLDAMNEWIKRDSGMNVRKRPGAAGYRCLSGQGYYVGTRNGKRITDPDLRDELCFAAPFAVSAMIDPANQAWLDRLWEAVALNPETDPDNPGYFNPDNPQSDYYGHTIALQVLLAVSGNLWTPK